MRRGFDFVVEPSILTLQFELFTENILLFDLHGKISWNCIVFKAFVFMGINKFTPLEWQIVFDGKILDQDFSSLFLLEVL